LVDSPETASYAKSEVVSKSNESFRQMTILVGPEHERVIKEAIDAGLIETADQVVDVGVDTILKRLELHGSDAQPMSADEWVQQFHSWVHSHPTTTPLLSDEAVSRESVYGTRGQ